MSEGNGLPGGWSMVTVREVAVDLKNGIYKAREYYSDNGCPCLRMYNIENGRLVWKDIKRIDLTLQEQEEYGLLCGDLLVNRVNSRELVGKACVIPDGLGPCVFESKNIRVKLRSGAIHPKFLNFSLLLNGSAHFRRNLQQTVGMASINQDQLGSYQFPMAPIAEQRRIVAKIEELFSDLDAGVAALERARANLKRYRASVLKAAVEGRLTEEWRKKHPDVEPAEKLLERILAERRRKWEAEQLAKFKAQGKEPPKNWKDKYKEPVAPDTEDLPKLPKGWRWVTADMLGEIVGGITKGQKRSQGDKLRSVAYLRVANVQRGFLDLSEIKEIEATEDEVAALRLLPGDVLFNEGGDRDKLGRGWVWNGEIKTCIHQNHVFRLRPFLPEVRSELISHHGNTFGKLWFQRAGKQSVNLASINMTVLRKFPIPLAPGAEQQEISELLGSLLDTVGWSERAVSQQCVRGVRLRQSILKRAFEGKLVPQDSSDEPASKLLERIKTERDAATADPTTNGKAKRGRPRKMPRRSKHK